MHRRVPTTLAVLALLALPPGRDLAAQVPSSAQVARIDSVFLPFDRTDRPGCALGVTRNGTMVYQRGYGMSNLEYGIAITPRSIFHVASISKQFTAFAIGLLQDEGKLSVDDDVHKYIPELPDYGKPITLRQLISHTSGIRDQWELLGMAGWRDDVDLITEQDILDIVTRQKALNFEPGSQSLYSNSGYTLLAIIVKRVSGMRLREFAAQRIFQPLGMHDTHFHNDHTEIVPNRTSAYVPRGEHGWKISIPVFDNDGATSLHTTVGDLLLWEQNFVDGKVGSRRLIEEAMTSSKLNDGSATRYGYGLSLEDFRGLRAIGHGGADAGYRADVIRFPDQGVAIAALCNFATATPNLLTRQVAAVLLEDRLTPLAAVEKPVTLSQTELEAVAGLYQNVKSDDTWELAVRNGGLVLANFGVPLTALGPTRFTAFGSIIEFTKPATGPREARIMLGDRVMETFRQVEQAHPTRTQLAAYAGEYYSPELDVKYVIAQGDSGLVLKRRKFDDAPLTPVFADGFRGEGGTIRFLRAKAGGKVTGFAVTGGRVRNLAFERLASRP